MHQHPITVGRRAGHVGHRQRATGTRLVFDDDIAAERLLHRLSEASGDDVGRAARGEGHDNGDRTRGVGLGGDGRGKGRGSDRKGHPTKQLGEFHRGS